MPSKYTILSTLLRIVVAVVTVVLCVMMIEQGGWWIAACLLWLPVNFVVTAAFGDADKPGGSEGAESSTLGD